MIIVRSPLRITLGGGGTDLPSYYREHGGFLISAAIDKYIYVGIMQSFKPGIHLKYSAIEHAEEPVLIQHPIFREALRMMGYDGGSRLEITTLADIPAGTGLGSSSSFATALVLALHAFDRRNGLLSREDIARKACEIEIERLGDPIGKQDQYIAAYGGITRFTFHADDRVEIAPVEISNSVLADLEDNLMLFFTGYSRSAGEILQAQDAATKQQDAGMIGSLHYIKQLGYRSLDALQSGNLRLFGELMHEHWLHKRTRSQGMTNDRIDEWYEIGRKNGAIGGKLVGAGGGGFLLFYGEDRKRLKNAMAECGLEEVRFRFDWEGAKVVMS